MTKKLATSRIKHAVRQLKADQAKRTKPCPECGGEPFAEDESSRICPVCNSVFYRTAAEDPGMKLHNLITEALEHGSTTSYHG